MSSTVGSVFRGEPVVIRVVLASVLMFAGAACSVEAAPREQMDVAEPAVEEFLGRVTAAAQSRDVEAVCRFGRSATSCDRFLAGEIDGSVPAAPPTVECRSVTAEGTWIVVRGAAEDGNEYLSRLLLVETDDGVRAQIPAFWTGTATMPTSTDGSTGSVTSQAPDASELTCP